MGCSSSKATTAIDDSKTAATTPTTPTTTPTTATTKDNKMEYPASEAFTIPLDDVANVSDQLNDTLRQPPKRLQQLMQQAAETEPLTLSELEDKQQKAEQRRQELMQQKIETIQKNTQMLMRGQGEHIEGRDDDEAEGQIQQQQQQQQPAQD